MRRLLLLAATLSLLHAPAALAGHGHGHGGGHARHGRNVAHRPVAGGAHARRAAAQRRNDRVKDHRDPRRGPRWRRAAHIGHWSRGSRLPPAYWRGRPLVDWRAHRLGAPPYGFQWVYVDGDYVLVALGSGMIADIVVGD